MKYAKLLSLVLAVVMCLSVLASCAASTSGKTPHTSSADDTGSDDGDRIQRDYGGEEFTFLYIKHSDVGKDYYGGDYLDADGYTGDTISDAVYARNLAVEELYNVDITQNIQISGDPASLLQEFYMSGDFCFDVIYGWTYKLGACITENYFSDFYDLPTVDFDSEYWGGTANDDLTIDEHLYLCMNDITMNKLQWGGFLYFNKNMYEDYNISTEYGNIYDLVRNKQWTLDTFLNIIQSVSNDLDGNGIIGKDDVYGILDGGVASGYVVTSGITKTMTNDNGSLSLSFYSEKLLNLIDKINPVYSNKNYVKNYDDIWSEGGTDGNGSYTDQWEYARSYFANDHALFCSGSAYETSEFRTMNSSYGIVPFPLYDTNQENYVTGIDTNASILALPATVRQVGAQGSMEKTSIILDYMAYKSNELLLPKYYDTLIKGQRLDSDDDSQMLDIVRDSIHFEITDCVGITDIGTVLSSMFSKPSTATSTYKRNEKKLQKAIDDFYSGLISLDIKNNTSEEE